MITGVLALIAAGGAIWAAKGQLNAARAQVALSKHQADRDRNGRLRATRASLPATLSSVCEFAGSCARALNDSWPQLPILYPADVPAQQVYRITATLPPFPPELIAPLERLVELTDVDAVAEQVERLLREVQVLSARGRALREGETHTTRDLSGFILEAATIYALAESLFGYARRQCETIDDKPLWDRVIAALSLCGIHRDEVEQLAKQEREQGQPPGEAQTLP